MTQMAVPTTGAVLNRIFIQY